MPLRIRQVPPWAVLAIISSCGLVVAMQFTLIIPLLPDLPVLLSVSSEDASWLVTATLLTSAVSTPIVAKMADMYGKRLMLIIALFVMIVGSLLCAVSTGFVLLIIGRAMQGFASSLIAVGISILRDELPREKVGTAVALMSATMGIGGGLGLPLAGILYEHLGWHSIFWCSAIAGLVLIVVIIVTIPESKVRTSGRFDVLGAIVFSAVLVCLLLPISKGATWGWTSKTVLLLLVLALVALAAWVPLQLRTSQPMVDLRTASRPKVLLTNIASVFVGFSMFVNMILTTQVLQSPTATGHGQGLDASTGGLAMIPMGIVMAVSAPFSGMMLNRIGGRKCLMIGAGIMSASYVGRVFFSDSVLDIIIGSTLVGLGTAIAFAAMPVLIMGAVPITETASANGLNTLVRSIGTSAASAVVAMIFAAFAVEIDGAPFPSLVGVDLILWLAAGAALIAVVFATLVPIDTLAPTARADAPPVVREHESVARGRVLIGTSGDSLAAPAIVSALTLSGEQVDWNRTDMDGRYSIALPGPGSFVVTATAQGWAAASKIVEYGETLPSLDITLQEELLISGVVQHTGTPCSKAAVSLTHIEGQLVGSATTDENGRFALQLPPTGRYVLTAVDPESRRTSAQKFLVAMSPLHIDFDL